MFQAHGIFTLPTSHDENSKVKLTIRQETSSKEHKIKVVGLLVSYQEEPMVLDNVFLVPP